LFFHTVPSANTLVLWVNENAFAPIVRARNALLSAYYEPLRHPKASGLSLAGVRLIVVSDRAMGFPVLHRFSSCIHAVATTPAEPMGAFMTQRTVLSSRISGEFEPKWSHVDRAPFMWTDTRRQHMAKRCNFEGWKFDRVKPRGLWSATGIEACATNSRQ